MNQRRNSEAVTSPAADLERAVPRGFLLEIPAFGYQRVSGLET
jgi:hypothetical protein